jgi:hypothetical protein
LVFQEALSSARRELGSANSINNNKVSGFFADKDKLK